MHGKLKFLHMANFFSTSLASEASDKYEVWLHFWYIAPLQQKETLKPDLKKPDEDGWRGWRNKQGGQ